MTILAEIKGQYEALDSFFRGKLDLHIDTILKAFEPTYWEWLESLKEQFSVVDIDTEWVAEYEKRLENAWNLMV